MLQGSPDSTITAKCSSFDTGFNTKIFQVLLLKLGDIHGVEQTTIKVWSKPKFLLLELIAKVLNYVKKSNSIPRNSHIDAPSNNSQSGLPSGSPSKVPSHSP